MTDPESDAVDVRYRVGSVGCQLGRINEEHKQ
ncbi:MAG: hypothetical protein RL685_69 [Pseudomonadota bacterium]|jgi:hypothetical protein